MRVPLRAWVSGLLLGVLLSASTLEGSADGPSEALGRLRIEVVDEQGTPVLARVRVSPFDFGERVRLAQWSHQRVLSRAGRAELVLVRGHYRVVVSRGPEWSLAELDLRIEPGRRVLRRVVLTPEVWPLEYRAVDLHVHTLHSEDAQTRGGVAAEDLLAEGVSLAVATDHNHIGDLGPQIASVAGAELTTWAPEVGHFNAFPLRTLPAHRGTTPAQLFRELSQDPDVFVQVNHPRLDDHIAYFKLGGFDGRAFARAGFHLDVPGLEVWNGYDLKRPDAVHALLAEWRGLIARGQRLTATGGSDSHGAGGHLPGYPRTYVRIERGQGLAHALRAGQAFVSNGPILTLHVGGKAPGETLRSHGGERIEAQVRLEAPSWMHVEQLELWVDERPVHSLRVPRAPPGRALSYGVMLPVSLDGAHGIVAIAHGGEGMERLLGVSGVEPMAFTNPVYVESSAQGWASAR